MSENHDQPQEDGKKYWLDDPKNVTRIFHGLIAVCVAVFAADFFYEKHPHFFFEYWFGFYAIFGFFAYAGIVLSAKQLRKLVKREEDYYDR